MSYEIDLKIVTFSQSSDDIDEFNIYLYLTFLSKVVSKKTFPITTSRNAEYFGSIRFFGLKF